MKRLHLFTLLALLLAQEIAHAIPSYITFPSNIDWVVRSSDHFDVLYRKGEDALAERALRAAERAHRLLTPIFPQAPPRTWIVLADFQDSTNGYSIDFPYPHMVIFAAPPEANGQLAALDDWFADVILHEYVHTLHLYPAQGLWKALRFVFGSWVLPNGMMPVHFHEGLAVLLETELTRGGRGRGTLFQMYQRMAVAAQVWGTHSFASLDRMDASITRWPTGSTPYFFGYLLNHELWSRKGPKGIYRLVTSYSSNWPYFVNIPLKEVYETTYPTLWEEIFKKTREESQKEIESIRKAGLSPLQYLTHTRFQKHDVVLSPDGGQVAYRTWQPSEGMALEVLDLKSSQVLRHIELHTNLVEGLCWSNINGKDYFLSIQEHTENWTAKNSLYWNDFKAKSVHKLDKLPWDHLHQLACSPSFDRLLVYREVAGKGSVLELSFNASDIEKGGSGKLLREWKIPEGTWVTSLLLGESYWITLRNGLSTSFYRWDKTGAPTFKFSVKGHVYNLRRSADPQELLAIADFDGREEIWSIALQKGFMKKRVALLGGVNGFDKASDFVVSSYEHGGYDIARATAIKSQPQSIPYVDVGTTQTPLPGTNISEVRNYSAWGTLLPHAWVPSLLFVPDGVQIGAWIPGFDVSQRHLYDIFGGYDSRGLAFVDFSYAYRFGETSTLGLGAYLSPSYILRNQKFLKRWGASVGTGSFIEFLGISWNLNLLFRRMEDSPLSSEKKVSVGMGVDLTKRIGFKSRPLSLNPIAGTKISLSHSQYFKSLGSDDAYFSTVASLDQFLETPWLREHVFYFGAKLGYTEGTSLLNSYFEGGGELLFNQGRGFFLNRGFVSGLFLARRMFALNLEYRFPIARIERGTGLWPAYFRNLSAALVSDATTFDFDPSLEPKDPFRVYYVSAGAELISNWIFLFYLPTKIRVGGYHGFGDFGDSFRFAVGIEAGV